jgi:hypothetical protein
MSALIRPLASRIDEARVNLAAAPFAAEPLTVSITDDARALAAVAPDVDDATREQVIREALSDALTYHHCEDDCCPHLTGRDTTTYAVLAMGRILCSTCIYVRGRDDNGAVELTEPWEGPGDAPCTLCGGAGPLASIWTRVSPTPEGMIYAAHVCATCAAWWPT